MPAERTSTWMVGFCGVREKTGDMCPSVPASENGMNRCMFLQCSFIVYKIRVLHGSTYDQVCRSSNLKVWGLTTMKDIESSCKHN